MEFSGLVGWIDGIDFRMRKQQLHADVSLYECGLYALCVALRNYGLPVWNDGIPVRNYGLPVWNYGLPLRALRIRISSESGIV